MGQRVCLQVERRHRLAAAVDDVLDPAGHLDVAVLEAADPVTGAVEAVRAERLLVVPFGAEVALGESVANSFQILGLSAVMPG